MSKISEKIQEIADPIAHGQGLEVVDIDYLKEGPEWILRVFLENPEGDLTLEHCETVSRQLSEQLDTYDPIDESYILEVSSPGLERPLKKPEDFNKYQGRLAKIKTFVSIDGDKEFKGILRGLTGDEVQLELDGEVINIPYDKIAKANLAIDF